MVTVLKATDPDGKKMEAVFCPEQGMNLLSYKKDRAEVIDRSTQPLFEERSAGLGAMIGPHFHHRPSQDLPAISRPELFPHIARLKAKGVEEPFPHGIGRYAPWNVEGESGDAIKATLRGSDPWKGIPMKELEGQDFMMAYEAHLKPHGLEISLSVASEKNSVAGLHTYYALSKKKGTVHAQVQDFFREGREVIPLPGHWNFQKGKELVFEVDEQFEIDCGFFPDPDPLQGEIRLDTETHRVRIRYQCENQEHSWQLWHPKGASFICIEPLSAKDPRDPARSASRIKIHIAVL